MNVTVIVIRKLAFEPVMEHLRVKSGLLIQLEFRYEMYEIRNSRVRITVIVFKHIESKLLWKVSKVQRKLISILVANEPWSEWTDWESCNCTTRRQTRSRTCNAEVCDEHYDLEETQEETRICSCPGIF